MLMSCTLSAQYLPTDLKAMPNFPDIGQDNPYLMSCSDGSIIDAMSYAANEVSDLSGFHTGFFWWEEKKFVGHCLSVIYA